MEAKVFLALLVVVVLVIGINGLLLAAFRKGRDIQQIRLWQKAARTARDPWQKENKDLAELSRLVTELKKTGEQQEPPA
ncbi:MAG: hypothetical protein Fur0022_08390 [Anaerolineales bacterium]